MHKKYVKLLEQGLEGQRGERQRGWSTQCGNCALADRSCPEELGICPSTCCRERFVSLNSAVGQDFISSLQDK